MIKEKRRRQRHFKQFLTSALIILAIAASIAFIVLKVFVVRTVKVEGNKLYDEQLITKTVLNDEYSWNSLYVLLKYTFTDTEEIPFIDTMEIKMNSPSTLTIKVYEKGLLGYLYIPAMNQMAYFDKDGIVVETSTRVIEGVPKIEGISCEEVVLFEKLPIENQQLRELLTLTQTLRREKIEPEGIHFGALHSPVLYYGNVEVWMGSGELLTQKVARLKEILPNILGMEGFLHLESWTEETSNIIFEKVEEELTEDADDESGDDADGSDDAGDNAENDAEGTSDETGDDAEGTGGETGDDAENTGDETGGNGENTGDETGGNGEGTGGETGDNGEGTGGETGDDAEDTGDAAENNADGSQEGEGSSGDET